MTLPGFGQEGFANKSGKTDERKGRSVYVISGARTDFSEKWSKMEMSLEDDNGGETRPKRIHDGIDEVIEAVLENAPTCFSPLDLDLAHIGNLDSAAYTNQGHLSGIMSRSLKKFIKGYDSMEIPRFENACASGGSAINSAYKLIRSGESEVAIIVGVEQMWTMGPGDVTKILAKGDNREFTNFAAPAEGFAQLARLYMEKYGIDEKTYDKAAGFAILNNYNNARDNPMAQLRNNSMYFEFVSGVQKPDKDNDDKLLSKGNPRFEDGFYPLKKLDCSQISDGAAALILASEDYMHKIGLDEGVAIVGSSLQVDVPSLEEKLFGGQIPDSFRGLTNALKGAFYQAGLEFNKDINDINYIELHDCFAITELIILEHLGFANPGEATKLGKKFWDEYGPRINPSGGLMGDGHPIGATGVRMMYELSTRLGKEGGKGMMVNIGDVLTSNYVAVLEKRNIHEGI